MRFESELGLARYASGMTERWSLSDMQVYGASDQDEMDAIMRALDKFEREGTSDLLPDK
ncbi:hypothetical protein ACC848_38185 [Rhizobium johnstonii]